MSDEGALYIKHGRRYERIGQFAGFPADGVWLVTHDRGYSSQRLIYPTSVEAARLGPVPMVPAIAEAEMLRKPILKALTSRHMLGLSPDDIATAIIYEVARTIGARCG